MEHDDLLISEIDELMVNLDIVEDSYGLVSLEFVEITRKLADKIEELYKKRQELN